VLFNKIMITDAIPRFLKFLFVGIIFTTMLPLTASKYIVQHQTNNYNQQFQAQRRLVSASSDHQPLSANVLAPNLKMLAQNGTLENFSYLENVVIDVDMEESDDDMFA
jgi:hypothetical protein